MDKVRYECRLMVGGEDLRFYCNDTDHILALVSAVCSGAQVRDAVDLYVTDTVSRGAMRSNISAETCLGFPQAVEAFLNALNVRRSKPVRPEEGRDVTVEVQFAAHGATLDDCRQFAEHMVDEALQLHGMRALTPEAQKFSCNGTGVGDAWFES